MQKEGMFMGILQGRIAFISGASRGIGKAIALAFAKEGAVLGLVARDEAKLQEVAAACLSAGASSVQVKAFDIQDKEACEEGVKSFAKDAGGLDILVNNAGITRDNLLMRMGEEDWDKVLDINLKSVFFLTKAAARYIMKSKFGRILNISSVIGVTGNAGQANYAASKGGLIALTKSLAKEFASRGVCVNALCPGMIDTDMTQELPKETRQEILKNIPLGRLGKPEDIAGLATFLASDQGSYITNQVCVIDGGMIG